MADAIPSSESNRNDEFDQELGKQMGRDAQRLVDGELSEAAFYEKYHDAVVEEFGEDNRPVEPGDGEV
jgi:molybdopterin-containing oxidoreductase family iron-sulfur binding subunit